MQLKLIIPDDVYEELKSRAKAETRPVANYIRIVLSRHVEGPAYTTVLGQSEQPIATPATAPAPAQLHYPTKIHNRAPTTATTKRRKSVIDAIPTPDTQDTPQQVITPNTKNYLTLEEKKTASFEDLEKYHHDINNSYYQKIRQYCMENDHKDVLHDMLAHPLPTYIKDNHDYTIRHALDIPATHELDVDDWIEIAGYLE